MGLTHHSPRLRFGTKWLDAEPGAGLKANFEKGKRVGIWDNEPGKSGYNYVNIRHLDCIIIIKKT
jgi:hypothetical protein